MLKGKLFNIFYCPQRVAIFQKICYTFFMPSSILTKICYYLASFLAVVIILTFHEFAHAFVAVKCGDNTPKYYGRLSLNPLKHFDVAGLIMFTLVGFGWAKPVPINPGNFNRYRRDSVLVSIAGVCMNLILAFLFCPLYFLALRYIPYENINGLQLLLKNLTHLLFAYNLSFFVFNLLPFYPLDGFRVVEALTKGTNKVYEFLRKYGQSILIGLIIESFLCDYISILAPFDVLGYFMSFAVGIVGAPITAFWSFIFGLF